jgi:hypothetical protein
MRPTFSADELIEAVRRADITRRLDTSRPAFMPLILRRPVGSTNPFVAFVNRWPPTSTRPRRPSRSTVDYKRVLKEFESHGALVRAFYYTTVSEDLDYVSLRPLLNWLDYNSFTVACNCISRRLRQLFAQVEDGDYPRPLCIKKKVLSAKLILAIQSHTCPKCLGPIVRTHSSPRASASSCARFRASIAITSPRPNR